MMAHDRDPYDYDINYRIAADKDRLIDVSTAAEPFKYIHADGRPAEPEQVCDMTGYEQALQDAVHDVFVSLAEMLEDTNKRVLDALLKANKKPEPESAKSTCVDCGKKPLSRACDRWYLAGYGPMCLTCFHERLPG